MGEISNMCVACLLNAKPSLCYFSMSDSTMSKIKLIVEHMAQIPLFVVQILRDVRSYSYPAGLISSCSGCVKDAK